MKIAISFLIVSMMVLVSHQQRFHQFVIPPWTYRQQPNIHDIYDYLFARSMMQSMNPMQHLSSNMRVNHGAILPEQIWPDTQSRNSGTVPEIDSSVAMQEPESNARVFLNYVTTAGGSSSYFNPFLKTVYYITSSTATTTLVKTCIPAASFTSSSSTVTCRKRREIMSILLGENNPEVMKEVEPTVVLPMEASVAARSLPIDDDAVMSPIELASSKSDEYSAEAGIFNDVETAREKRFLFAASTTITSYVFVTTTSTKTLTNLGSTLLCIPSLFALC